MRTATCPSTQTTNRRQTTPKSAPVQAPSVGGYGAAEVAAASELRRRDLHHLAGITDVLADVEQSADELNRTAAELGWLVGNALAMFVAVAKCSAQAVRLPPPDLGDQQ